MHCPLLTQDPVTTGQASPQLPRASATAPAARYGSSQRSLALLGVGFAWGVLLGACGSGDANAPSDGDPLSATASSSAGPGTPPAISGTTDAAAGGTGNVPAGGGEGGKANPPASAPLPDANGAAGTGGAPPLGPDADGAASGGTTDPVSDGRATGDEVVAAAGADGSSGAAGGGSSTTPVDCRGISNAGWDLCSATDDSCAAVFNDGAGCIAVCAAVGLECIEALENLEDSCGADTSLPATACASGHQSDYCVCGGDAPSGSGGVGNAGAGSGGADTGGVGNAGAGSGGTAAGAGGEAGAGGSGGAPPTGSDCNTATGTLFEVASDGSAQFNTVQAAVDSASGNEPTIIRISPGTYYEKLDIQSSQITLCGQMGQEANTLLTYDDSASDVGTSGSYSVRIGGDDVSVENLTLENSTGSGVQAVALLAQGNRLQFRNCRFIGYQDTVYTHSGSQYFRHCFIQGSVDYIFGGATAVFEECTMYNIEGGTAITAPSTEEGVPFGLVFLGGEVTAHDSVSNSSMALGRNWRPYGSTTYIGTELGDHISAVGWVPMGDNTLDTARFSEYQTTGPGANPEARASRSSQLSDAQAATYTVANIFGSWTPSFSE